MTNVKKNKKSPDKILARERGWKMNLEDYAQKLDSIIDKYLTQIDEKCKKKKKEEIDESVNLSAPIKKLKDWVPHLKKHGIWKDVIFGSGYSEDYVMGWWKGKDKDLEGKIRIAEHKGKNWRIDVWVGDVLNPTFSPVKTKQKQLILSRDMPFNDIINDATNAFRTL